MSLKRVYRYQVDLNVLSIDDANKPFTCGGALPIVEVGVLMREIGRSWRIWVIGHSSFPVSDRVHASGHFIASCPYSKSPRNESGCEYSGLDLADRRVRLGCDCQTKIQPRHTF